MEKIQLDEKYNLTKLTSFINFSELELTRNLSLKSRNSFLKMIFSLFKKHNDIGFLEFSEIDKELNKFFHNIESDKNFLDILISMKSDLENEMLKQKFPENKLAIAYIISRIKDREILWSGHDADKLSLLKANLKVGDILLLNKKLKRQDIWSKLLKVYDNKYLTDFSHSAVFIEFDEDWNIVVRHSTTKTEIHDMKWVEDALLNKYMFDEDKNDALGYDILVLRPNHDIKNDILHFTQDKIWKQYDSKTALRQWLWLKKQYNDKYNCVELIVQWLNPSDEDDPLNELKLKTFPNDFLEYLDIFKPVYMTTIKRS